MARKSPKGPRTVGGIEFDSLAALKRYIRELLNGYDLYVPIDAPHDAFLRALLEHHPRGEAKLAGRVILHFEKHPAKGGSRCFYMVFADRRIEDFGCMKCAEACFREPNAP